MNFMDFYNAINEAVAKQNECAEVAVRKLERVQFFLNEIEKLNNENIEPLKMTQASILFEGFYCHLSDTELKRRLVLVRAQRWIHHYGTPTVPFLLSYKTQINQTKQFFDKFVVEPMVGYAVPWYIRKEERDIIDHDNNVVIDPWSMSRIPMPQQEELGVFTKTHNPSGGYTTVPCDFISQRFIEHAAFSAQTGGKVLEIGAAFGAATLEALANGVTVFCNDIEPENLAVVHKRFSEASSEYTESITGDSDKLVLIPGELPSELIGLPERFFDAILICRVLHFFSGLKIEESLSLMSKLLAPGGKIYIVCETPFLKNWQRFIPEFKSRVEKGIEWPGEITNPADYESSGRAASLPKFVHWISKEVLERCLLKTGFSVEHAEYINREGQFPDDLLLPEYGKESVGAIGLTSRI